MLRHFVPHFPLNSINPRGVLNGGAQRRAFASTPERELIFHLFEI